MAVSEVSICSNALRKLGDKPITSLSDDNDRARLCNALYEINRDAALRAYPWNFAITRAALGQLASTPAFEFSYEYQLPASPYSLRVLTLFESDSNWKIEGRKLLTDDNSASIIYIARVTDTAEFDALFVETLTSRLAAELAWPLIRSNSARESFYAEFRLKLQEARAIDAQEGSAEILINDELTTRVRW